MDTEPKYRNDTIIEVEMTDALPEDSHRQAHTLNEDVPVDGRVSILYRDPDNPQSGREKDGRWIAGTFPFRDHRKDGHPWFARPQADEFSRHPVWKWQNPEEDPFENLTLRPSIGLGDSKDDLYLHCYIEDGGIRWL